MLRSTGKCTKCLALRVWLDAMDTLPYSIMDVDTPDGMAYSLMYDIKSVPALIDGGVAYTDMDDILARLKA